MKPHKCPTPNQQGLLSWPFHSREHWAMVLCNPTTRGYARKVSPSHSTSCEVELVVTVDGHVGPDEWVPKSAHVELKDYAGTPRVPIGGTFTVRTSKEAKREADRLFNALGEAKLRELWKVRYSPKSAHVLFRVDESGDLVPEVTVFFGEDRGYCVCRSPGDYCMAAPDRQPRLLKYERTSWGGTMRVSNEPWDRESMPDIGWLIEMAARG